MTALALDDTVCQLEIVGPAEAPVIVVLGGISASRHVTTWWNDFTGPGKTIDTDRYRVASIDYRSADADGRPLSTLDHARELCHALDAENIDSIQAIVGASYGGMIALAFGSIASDRVGRLIVFGAAHESSPVATAHRILQRRVVEIGLQSGAGLDSLIVARGRSAFVILNLYPYNSGHLMIVPNRHVASLAELSAEERGDVMDLTARAEVAVTEVYRPQGLNIGVNLGKAAGAGIADHLHVHVVPRWTGDTNFMSVVGNVRVLPEEVPASVDRLRPVLERLEGRRGVGA